MNLSHEDSKLQYGAFNLKKSIVSLIFFEPEYHANQWKSTYVNVLRSKYENVSLQYLKELNTG